MKLIAHRGESMDAPENTMEAFRLAWERNVDGIEGDFHLMKDGKIACMHDADTFRTTGARAKLAELDSKTLKKLDAGSWKDKKWKGAKVPLIEEVIDAVPEGKEIFVEVKDENENILLTLNDMIRTKRIKARQVVIITFFDYILEKAKKILPESKVLLLTGIQYEEGNGFKPSIEELIVRMKRLDLDGIDCCDIKEIDKNFVDSFKEEGFEVHVWTVNDAEQAKRLADAGVDSITSDCASKIKEALTEKKQSK